MSGNLKSRILCKSASWSGALFFVQVFAAGECAAAAFQPPTTTAEIGLSALRFDYAEYRENGSILDRELGGIPGWSFNLARRFSAWEWEWKASYHFGRVNYTGQTQAGAPYNTNTEEGVGDVAFRLGRWFGGGYKVMPYAGFGYRRWERDIQSASLPSLYESYRWKYAWVGAKFMAYQHGTSDFVVDCGWIKPIDPMLHVDAYNASLNPESRDGLRLVLTSHMSLSKTTMLIQEPYYEYWRLGRSPSVTSGRYIIYEPASETKNFGINLRLGQKF